MRPVFTSDRQSALENLRKQAQRIEDTIQDLAKAKKDSPDMVGKPFNPEEYWAWGFHGHPPTFPPFGDYCHNPTPGFQPQPEDHALEKLVDALQEFLDETKGPMEALDRDIEAGKDHIFIPLPG